MLVASADMAPQLIEVPRTSGLHILHLERRALVSGFVTVDGAIPVERIGLQVGRSSGMILGVHERPHHPPLEMTE